MKYNYAILFLENIFFIFFCFKICFLIDIHCKKLNVFHDPLKIARIAWSLLRMSTQRS